MRRTVPFIAVVLAGCAAGEQPALVSAGIAEPPAPVAQPLQTATAYELSQEELKLDCKQLTGRMRVRILQLRSAEPSATTQIARFAQTAVTPFLGGTRHGLDPVAERASDRAMLIAYNRRLKEKNCPTLNLEAELGAPAEAAVPVPVSLRTK